MEPPARLALLFALAAVAGCRATGSAPGEPHTGSATPGASATGQAGDPRVPGAGRGSGAGDTRRPAAPPPTTTPGQPPGAAPGVEGDPWASREACQGLVRRGARLARPPATARLGTWNVRWFPHGTADPVAGLDEGTDVAWLACAIAWLDVDALAVQEFKGGDAGAAAGRALTEALRELTGATWTLTLDACAGTEQHVGILWREGTGDVAAGPRKGELAGPRGVLATAPRTEVALHPKGRCGLGLRPGLSSVLRWPGGLSLELVAVHLDSGTTARDHRNRQASLQAAAALALPAGEDDRVLLGDFNLMGCADCMGTPDGAAELELSRAALAGMRILPGGEPCTRVGRGTPVLDRVAVRGLAELPAGARVRVTGACLERCDGGRGRPAVDRLSDHCPVLLDLPDRDTPG